MANVLRDAAGYPREAIPAYALHSEHEAGEYIVDVFMSPCTCCGPNVKQVRLSDGLGPFTYVDGLGDLDNVLSITDTFRVCMEANQKANDYVAA